MSKEKGDKSTIQKGGSTPFWPNHIKAVRNSDSWLSKSYQFKSAAIVLYDAYSKSQRVDFLSLIGVDTRKSVEIAEWQKGLSSVMPCIVCLGYSMELMFKALIVQNNPELIPEKGKVSFDKSHSLVRLAKQADIVLSEDEDKFLKRLSDYLVWGRYPTKVTPSQYRDFHEDREDYHPAVIFHLPEFYIPNMNILDRICNIYYERRKA